MKVDEWWREKRARLREEQPKSWLDSIMKKAAVQILAQIRLNLSSVDQFLAIACGLGDDNPDIRDQIYAAADEVRSSSLLIDHLRNLFNHQQSIEARQELFGGDTCLVGVPLSSSSLQQHHSGQFQSSNLALSTTASSRQQQQQEQAEKSNFARSASNQQQRGTHNAVLLFTYSNQQTLLKAAKCLVANVAKILYLTDSILAQTSGSQMLLETNSCQKHFVGQEEDNNGEFEESRFNKVATKLQLEQTYFPFYQHQTTMSAGEQVSRLVASVC